ncbi:MAG: metallophosphoesterase family protein [Candidatus Omnitrophica bacterium]|nr:metallophosphoesterase family protein [Candidatus Omnitrophota bacterium]MDD5671778.1 metallophosphoesterase family protein [Candidatus Omnitrophota bacterium]
MKHIILADIHGNQEALETVIAHLRDRDVGAWIVLGDTVGYGANPNECFEWVLQNAKFQLMGNHEEAVVHRSLRDWFSGWAREAIDWTDRVLRPEFKKEISALSFMRIENQITFAHASPDTPDQYRYLMRYEDAVASFKKMENAVGFVGHTHVPSFFSEEKHTFTWLKEGCLSLAGKGKMLLNPGSVGQPRDGDSRLSFGIFDDENKTFEIVRLVYDNVKAANKIRKAGLPRFLADRLL